MLILLLFPNEFHKLKTSILLRSNEKKMSSQGGQTYHVKYLSSIFRLSLICVFLLLITQKMIE